jgi:DNA primase
MDFYEQLKLKNDIVTVAFSLGYSGKKSGSCYQGECPNHASTGGICLVIWPRIQGFKCFHCGEKGDVIDLVMLFKNWDHKRARDFLADRVRMPHLGDRNLSPEEIEKREAEVKEKSLVEDMLTQAARWYHEQLTNHPDIMTHLENHYGFSPEIIDELLIGFAPPPGDNGFSELAEHLSSDPNFKGNLSLSGLFTFPNPSGPFYDYFRGRIIFPYWKGGKVVYMAGRATTLTPCDQYECYAKDGDLRKDEQGNPAYIKYKKLRTHDPEDEKKRFISKFIQNDVFLGEDCIHGEKEIVITEGFPDWISATDKGFAAISPVTTNFREKDFEKLGQLTQNADAVYIVNDNEENQAGLKGAINTAKYLTQEGRNVFLVELPRPKDKEKVDLNEYLVDHTPEDLRTLMASSRSFLEILIDGLPRDFVKAEPTIRAEIAPILIKLDKGILEHFIDLIRRKTKTNQKAILAEIEAAQEENLKQLQKKEETTDPEVQQQAKKIGIHPLSFKHRLDMINQSGVVGERGTLAMYYAALDSRLLPPNYASPNTLSIKNAGHFGAGKSFTLMMCLELYPEVCYKLITNGSAKSIYYLKEGLKNKALIVTEGFQFQENKAVDSELVYTIRSLISEGRVRYPTVEKDDKGNLITVEKAIDGPTSFITTTIMESLEAQMEDRLFTIHPDESFEQTRKIIRKIGETKAGRIPSLDKKVVAAWKLFHKSLKPVDVIVPYAEKIAGFITQREDIPIATRRAFNRVMVVIQAIACFYQNQRQRDNQGRVIAEISDYSMALQVVHEAFRENMGDQSKKTEDRLKVVMDQGLILPKDLAKKLGLSGTTISDWSKKKIQEGTLVWCDEYGQPFWDEKDLKKAKHTGKAYLKVSDAYTRPNVAGLPTPFELTKDNRWNEGGELLLEYDLDLEVKPKADEVIGSVLQVFGPPPNTPASMETIQNIEDSDDEEEAVRVFGPERGGINQSANKEINFDNLIF